uniref:Zinc-hook domain-containing protein n=1 Tax=Mesocestoides corti TaxID=53468 RepID=A0A5K3F6G3_MESCO
MSMLEEMSIQGIRSFGPENPQRIKFSAPVTLILGPNGTGKTTIIECLKYAITGESPPGSRNGASFIHDPKLTRSVEVKAKVAVKAKDVKNSPLIVSRSLVATRRGTAKQPTLKTLDGTIKRLTPTGQTVSLSSRCGEINKEMENSLGASKAVFENVIFCHQEESNWPLQEAKAVKERFDDLFASSRYVKALDAIRKSRISQNENVKVFRAELTHLSRSKEEANKLRGQALDTKCALNSQMQVLAEVDKQLDPVTAELTLYRKKSADLVNYQSEARSCAAEKASLEAVFRDLSKNIGKEFEGTDAELNNAIEHAEEQLLEKQQSLVMAEGELKRHQTELEANEKKRSELIVRKTQLDVEVKRMDQTVQKRNELLGRLAARFELNGISQKCALGSDISTDEVDAVHQHLNRALREAETQLSQTKASTEANSQKAQKAVDEARSALVRMEQSIAGLECAMTDNTTEISAVKTNLERANAATGELETVSSKLAEAKKARELLEASMSESEVKSSIQKAEIERSVCETDMALLDAQIDEAQRNVMKNHEIIVLERNRNAAIEKARKLRSRQLESLEQIFAGEIVPAVVVDESQTSCSLAKLFNSRFTELTSSSKAAQHSLNKLQQQLSKLEMELSFQRNQLREKQDEMRQMEERLLSACGTVDVERRLENVATRKEQVESDCATEEGSLYLWKKFRDRLSHESECPLCHRNFENEQDHQELIEELDKRLVTVPHDLAAKRKELQQIVAQYETLIELKPVSVNLLQLKDSELPALEGQVRTIQSRLEELQSKIEQETSKLECIQADESVARSLQGDIAFIEKLEKEIASQNRSLKLLTAAPEGTAPNLVPDLQEKRNELRVKRNNLSAEIDDLRTKLEQKLAERQKAVNKENELRNTLLNLEKEFQSVTHLRTELNRLTSVRARVSGELEVLRGQLPTCRSALDAAEAEKQSVSAAGKKQVADALAEWQLWTDQSRQVVEACAAATFRGVDASCGEHPKKQLERVTNELSALDGVVGELKLAIENTSNVIEALRTTVANNKIFQRELEDCVLLRQTRSQLSLLNVQVQEIQRKIDACKSGIPESADLVEYVSHLSDKEDGLRKQRQVVNDRITRLQTELRMLECSLSEKYADAETEYMKKMYELKIAELAATDLQHFHEALDRAIMAYHTEKMDEVNELIRDLWRTTYRGNDIDYIKICSEEEPLSVAANAAKTRRTYNYRVVMVKTGSSAADMGFSAVGSKQARVTSTETLLDMRGRCSAGQKVLASLVIRLALAEVFCLQCGVLALDEPTTNLDRENIESLAYALTEIIKTRSSQRNFQLIIITHDEDFIELLARAGCGGHLLRLVRNLEGLSEIQNLRIEDLIH